MVVLSSTQVIVPGVGEMAQWVRVLAVQAWVPSTHEENWGIYVCMRLYPQHFRVEGGRSQQLMAKPSS